ncbi:MAG: hypothetical protein MUF64_07425 [Polyangiaceae bacterium]|jgi:3-oxoacyl-[acyl-carrier-protein] synthase-3|nr:hypothetical protein [Polyangiaceae bacterium]
MKTTFCCSRIAGVAAAVPAARTDLSLFAAEWGERDVANIIQSTGITHVREARPGMTTVDLCEAAARSLLASLGTDPAEIDGIVFVSQTPDHVMPASSAILQHRLGLARRVAAFDVSYGCSGYVYGLLQADLLVHAGLCGSVLVCAGDTTARLVNPRDRALRMLFGDGGSATLVTRGEDRHTYAVRTDGSGARSLIVPAGGARLPRSEATGVARKAEDGNVRSEDDLFMDGVAVLFMALRDVPEAVDEAAALAGWSRGDVSFYGLHQANRFMIEYLARKLGAPPASVPFGAADVGNTGPASIPALLAREHPRLAAEGRLERSVLCGFGVGFSVAAMTASLSSTTILDLIEVELPMQHDPDAVTGVIRRLVLDWCAEHNEVADGKVDLAAGDAASLFGVERVLDSLSLVRLLVAVEQGIEDELGVTVLLADAKAASQVSSPFRTVGSLVAYAAARVIEESGPRG